MQGMRGSAGFAPPSSSASPGPALSPDEVYDADEVIPFRGRVSVEAPPVESPADDGSMATYGAIGAAIALGLLYSKGDAPTIGQHALAAFGGALIGNLVWLATKGNR